MFWSLLGLLAGAICISGFIPQIVKGYKTKRLDDLSYLMLFFLSVGMFLWIFYGSHFVLVPVIVTNIVGVICNVTLLIMKFIYSRR
jgi:MtN3 and saliva related transmembrane protein